MYDDDDVIAAKQDKEQWTNPEKYEDRKERERQEEIEREIGLLRLQCTDVKLAENYIGELADPCRTAAVIFRMAALYQDDTATLGTLVSTFVNNLWRIDAEYIVDKRLAQRKD